MTDKPLAVEYKGKQRLFTYEVFKNLKYGVTETNQNIHSDYSNKEQSGDNKSSSKEDVKEEEEDKSEFYESDQSNKGTTQERDDHHAQSDISLLWKEIKELRDDIKVWMERLIAPLNTIANHIVKNQGLKIELQNPSSSIPVNNQRLETHQSEVIVHKIEDYEAIRGLYPFEIFIKEKLPSLDSKLQKEYSKALDIAGNIAPLAYFLYMNSYLSPQTIKSFVVTWKEYYIEYREFNLEMLKSLFIEKDLKQLETKETLIKKWKQWKRIWYISFGISKDNFPIIEFSSAKKAPKLANSKSVDEIVEEARNVLTSKGKTADALLIHLMYALGSRTGEVKYLRFEDVKNTITATIKVYDIQKRKEKIVSISQELYNEIKQYEKQIKEMKKYFKSIRTTPDEASISGYFIFEECRETISRKFQSKFKGALKNFKLKPKDLRIASILKRSSKYLPDESEVESKSKERKVNKTQRVSSDKEQNSKEQSKGSDLD